MAAGAEVGARILFLTGAEQRLDVESWERGLALDWRAWRERSDEAEAWGGNLAFEARVARLRSPAHLSAAWSDGDLALAWVRRARKGGDPWAAGEPLHEVAEAYRVKVASAGGPLREWDEEGPAAIYPEADRAADFPTGGEAVVAVAQLGMDGEPGAWTSMTVTIPSP